MIEKNNISANILNKKSVVKTQLNVNNNNNKPVVCINNVSTAGELINKTFKDMGLVVVKQKYSKKYRQRYNDENKEKISVSQKNNYDKNTDKIKTAQRFYYHNHKEKIALRMKKYYLENKEKIIAKRKEK